MTVFNYNDLFVGSKNHLVTKGLFYDTYEPWRGNSEEYCKAYFERKNADKDGWEGIVIEDLYFQYCKVDPSEYTFAVEVFGSMKTWERISKSPILNTVLTDWRNEIAQYHKASALKSIIREAKDGKSKFSAAKWLYENGFIKEKPSKKQKENPEHEEDMDRVLKVLKGGKDATT